MRCLCCLSRCFTALISCLICVAQPLRCHAERSIFPSDVGIHDNPERCFAPLSMTSVWLIVDSYRYVQKLAEYRAPQVCSPLGGLLWCGCTAQRRLDLGDEGGKRGGRPADGVGMGVPVGD